jgi:hypothetical protein
VRRPVFYVKTRGFRTVGPSGAPLGLCLDAVCSLLAPCGALLQQNYVFLRIKLRSMGYALFPARGLDSAVLAKTSCFYVGNEGP